MHKLLIVDDNELNIDMLSKWLKKKGFNIIAAQNGQEGIIKASTESPDLILMDLTMPVTDGWQATAKLKSLPETRSIPVIALSAHDSDEDRLSALEAGCDDYECKPLNLKRVTDKICKLLESSDRRPDSSGNRTSPSVNDQIRQYIVKHFDPHIDAIVRNCLTLRKILLEKSDSEELEDLERILSGSTLFREQLIALSDEELRAASPGDRHTIANIRHDLRTPLNTIFGYTKILAHSEEQLHNLPEHHPCSAILTAATALNHEIDLLGQEIVKELPPPESNLNSNPEISSQLRRISQHSDANKLTGRILVVDDVEQNRLLLQRQLTPDGHTISVADSGAVALDMIQQQEFDLILLDIMMPDLNGLELLEILKSSEKHQQIPIIVISGLGDMDAVAPCISAGAEDYLTKPFNPVLLRARINSSLQKKKWGDKERGYIAQIEGEKKRSEAILQSILPSTILKRLKQSNEPIADRFDDVTVMFADIVGFTSATESMTPEEVLEWLDDLFSKFDQLAEAHGVEKIKTIGDAYMVACGAPLPRSDHADRILDFAASLLTLTNSMAGAKNPVVLRIGVHSGPVVAGLLGRHRYVYDLWGETVNIASRIESHGIENSICVSARVADQSNTRFNFTSRGKIMLKGVGLTEILTLKTNSGAL